MPPSLKSSKKPKPLTGFKIYRDQKGRFISKAAWQAIPKKKRKSSSVAIQRDVKGRFVSEKFLPSSTRLAKEKVKPKKKLKAKLCNYSKVFEIHNQFQINKLNVTGVQTISLECLAQLLDQQIARGAYLFRFWYSGRSYYTGTDEGKMRSTPLINQKRIQIEFGNSKNFLKQIGGPVIYYWMDLYGGPKKVSD